MSDAQVFRGGCYCGAVEVEVRGQPVAAAICHCESCRKWHAAPINAWALWPDAAVSVPRGADGLLAFDRQGGGGPSTRTSCARCGGALFNRKPLFGMTVVYAMTLHGSGFVFEPTFHCYYGERVLDVADGLPKFEDLPARLGGSDEQVEEPAATAFLR